MKDEPRKLDQMAEVRALINRMQPGEMLHLGERPVAQYFYARLEPHETSNSGKYLELISPDYEAVLQIQLMIENMVSSGELVETGDNSNWTKRLPTDR